MGGDEDSLNFKEKFPSLKDDFFYYINGIKHVNQCYEVKLIVYCLKLKLFKIF